MSNLNMLLVIDSRLRSTGTDGDFIYIPNSISINKVRGFRVNKVTVPYSFYSVILQTFIFNYGGTNYNITIPAGNYTAYQLASTVQSNIAGAIGASTVTVQYLPIQNAFEISSSASTFQFNFAGSVPTTMASYSVGAQMGLLQNYNLSYTIPATANLTSPYSANLSATSNIYLRSRTLGIYYTSYFQNNRDNIICSIPINVNAYNWIIYSQFVPTIFDYDKQNLNQIDFSFLDDFGNILDFRGQNCIIEVEIQFKDT